MSDTPQHIASELRRLSRKCDHYCNDPRAMRVQAAAVIEQMAEGLAQMTRERDEARAEVTRLIAEVVNRNKRALDGDQAIHVANRLIDDNDALRAEVERLKTENKTIESAFLDAAQIIARLDPEGVQKWLDEQQEPTT